MGITTSSLIKQKLALLEEVKKRKNVLFGSFNNTTKLEKEAAWKEVLVVAHSMQLASADKDWRYARDNLFGLWKSRTLVKINLYNLYNVYYHLICVN